MSDITEKVHIEKNLTFLKLRFPCLKNSSSGLFLAKKFGKKLCEAFFYYVSFLRYFISNGVVPRFFM